MWCKVIENICHTCFVITRSSVSFHTSGPFYWHGLTLIPAWISNRIHYNVWDEITYPFLNFNGATVEIHQWISNFIPHFSGHAIASPCWLLKLNHVCKKGSHKYLSSTSQNVTRLYIQNCQACCSIHLPKRLCILPLLEVREMNARRSRRCCTTLGVP